MNTITKRVLRRTVISFLAGAFSSMATITVFAGQGLEDVKAWLFALAVSGLVGGITGLIMGLDKLFRDLKAIEESENA
jgi:ABC-type uncharacterized transport system permease subunit